MAGDHHHGPLAEDPAVKRYANLYYNRFRFFRWTPRTAKITFLYVAVIPTIIAVLGYKTEGKYEFRGKRRGDIIQEY